MRGEPFRARKTKIIMVITAGNTLSCLPRSRADRRARRAVRLEVSWQARGWLRRWRGRGQGMRRGEEEHGAEGFPAWQDEGCGPAGPVSPAQAPCHEGSHVCRAAGAPLCPAPDPALTLLFPQPVPQGRLSDRLPGTRPFVLLNINWWSPHSARVRTGSHPGQLRGPSSAVSTRQRQMQKQKCWVMLSKVPWTAGSRGRGVAQTSSAVPLQGGNVARCSLSGAVHPPGAGVQGG